MKFECDMISDLLPLYKDDICSEASRKIVEEHLAECPACKKLFSDMSDVSIDEQIVKEKNEVINSQARFFKRKSAVAGSIIGMIFFVPILVCLIVNLATGAGLTWFFIVLSALLVAASLIIVPLMVPKNKMFTTMVSFTVSVLVLLAVCCIYAGGYWFIVAAPTVLFGLTLLFAPFIAARRPVNAYIGKHKGLAVMTVYTMTFFIMMGCIAFYTGPEDFLPLAMSISLPLVALAWAILAICRYLRVNACTKTGLCIASAALLSGVLAQLVSTAEAAASETGVVYSSGVTIPPAIVIVVGLLIAGIGFLFGKLKGGKKNEKK